MESIWKTIETDRFYAISNMGQVMNTKRNRLLKPQTNNGYLYVCLPINGKWKNMSIHQLVANAFIPNIENKGQINHKDGNKNNNHVKNLEWVTCLENNRHAWSIGLCISEKCHVIRINLERNIIGVLNF